MTDAARTPADYGLIFEEPPEPRRHAGGRPGPKSVPREPRPLYIAPDSHRPHGTYVKYVVERCTCDPCRAANRDYERARARAMRRPDQAWIPYVSAGRARRHLAELAAAGVGLKTVAKLSGLSHGALSRLVYGQQGRAPSKRIRPETERKVLAVTVEQAAGGQKIPGGPTWKLLDDLIARGFTKAWINHQLGNTSGGLHIRRDVVRASTARKVEELHRRFQGVAAPPRRTRWSK